MRARCARTCSSARSSVVKIVNSFIGSTAVDAMNDSTTASCATATRDTQSRFARPLLIAASLYSIERQIGDGDEQSLLDVEQPDRARARQAGGHAREPRPAIGRNHAVDVGAFR